MQVAPSRLTCTTHDMTICSCNFTFMEIVHTIQYRLLVANMHPNIKSKRPDIMELCELTMAIDPSCEPSRCRMYQLVLRVQVAVNHH